MVWVVGDEHDGHTGIGGVSDVLENDAGLLHTECTGGLVEDEHVGAEVHGAGDRHRLALPSGQGSHGLLGVPNIDSHLG